MEITTLMRPIYPELDEAIASGVIAQDPYSVYANMRRDTPICWSEQWGCWVVCRHADIAKILQDTRRFSSVGRVVNAMQKEYDVDEQQQVRPLINHYSQGLINADPPDHTRLRKLVQVAFVPRTLERLKPRVADIVDGLIANAKAAGQMEMIRDFSYPLPVTVIAELMGVPTEMHAQFKSWSGRIVEFMATPCPTLETTKRSQTALLELREYFKTVFAECRAKPAENLISDLVNVALDGDRLTEDELLSTCVTILIGGHETTTSLLTSAIQLLLTHPDQVPQLFENPAAAVEEFLRFEPPFQRILRTAIEPVPLHDQTIAAGDNVILLLGSANRDESVYPEADQLNLARRPSRHVSFGFGPHFCLGAALARLEVPIALQGIIQAFPGLQLRDASLVWHDGMIRCLESLHLSWD